MKAACLWYDRRMISSVPPADAKLDAHVAAGSAERGGYGDRAWRAWLPPAGLAVALGAYFGLFGTGAPGLAIGAAACALAGGMLLAPSGGARVWAGTVAPVALAAAGYLALGAFLLGSGQSAPDAGYAMPPELGVLTVIASAANPNVHEASYRHVLPADASSAELHFAAVDDPRVRAVHVDVLGPADQHTPLARDDRLRAGVYFDRVASRVAKLRVRVEVMEPVPATEPVTLVVFEEHGRRDTRWLAVRWYTERHGR